MDNSREIETGESGLHGILSNVVSQLSTLSDHKSALLQINSCFSSVWKDLQHQQQCVNCQVVSYLIIHFSACQTVSNCLECAKFIFLWNCHFEFSHSIGSNVCNLELCYKFLDKNPQNGNCVNKNSDDIIILRQWAKKFSFSKKKDVVNGYSNDGVCIGIDDRNQRLGNIRYGTFNDLLAFMENFETKMDNLEKLQILSSNEATMPTCGLVLEPFRNIINLDNGWYIVDEHFNVITKPIGVGAFGTCNMAYDRTSKMPFCIKQERVKSFRPDELVLLCQLHHDSVVVCYGIMMMNEHALVLMEMVPGGTLRQAMEKSPTKILPTYTTLMLIKDMLYALEYLENKCVLHEDIKADNVMVRNRKAVLIDFGLARKLNPQHPVVRKGEHPKGSETHWSPEKARSEEYSYESDVWAVLCTAIHIMTGIEPWRRRYPNVKTLIYVIATKPPPHDDLPSSLPTEVRDLFTYAFSGSAVDRPRAHLLLTHPVFQHTLHIDPNTRPPPDVVDDSHSQLELPTIDVPLPVSVLEQSLNHSVHTNSAPDQELEASATISMEPNIGLVLKPPADSQEAMFDQRVDVCDDIMDMEAEEIIEDNAGDFEYEETDIIGGPEDLDDETYLMNATEHSPSAEALNVGAEAQNVGAGALNEDTFGLFMTGLQLVPPLIHHDISSQEQEEHSPSFGYVRVQFVADGEIICRVLVDPLDTWEDVVNRALPNLREYVYLTLDGQELNSFIHQQVPPNRPLWTVDCSVPF